MIRPPRDHDIVGDDRNRFLIVIGNLHPPNGLIAYLKYVESAEETLWRYRNVFYKRVLESYGVKTLHKNIPKYQKFIYDYVFGTYVPVINLGIIKNYYYPEIRFREIISKASDELELTLLEFTDILMRYIKNINNYIGVTGSLLTKTHNVNVSDIDVVIYGCKCSKEFLESLSNFNILRPTYEELLKQSTIHGLPIEVLTRIYPPFKKLLINDKLINVIFVDDSQPPRYGSEIYVNLHPIELIAEVRPRDCKSLFYPSIAYIDKVIEITHPKNISSHDEITYIASYEGLYSYVLYLGGRLRIRGILQKIIPTGKYRALVGGIEEPGYVIPSLDIY
ncbi:MAG: nucleotidyltransferase domain-containing protein [Sulfolobales archaeon]